MTIVDTHTPEARYFKFDILHIHWPEFFVTLRPFYIAIVLAPTVLSYMIVTRLLGKRIVWTVHDVTPPRTSHLGTLHLWLLRVYLSSVRVLVDAFVFMTPSSEAEFKRIFPRAVKKPACHMQHGPYPVSATSPRRLAELREWLSGGTHCLLVGFLGDLIAYKNPQALAYLPRRDSIGREIKIVVAGVTDPAFDPMEIEVPLSRIPPKQLVRIRERLSDDRLADVIRAVDVVLLPYLQGSNSGFSMLVLSCGQRMLCSALPMFKDLRNRLGPPWVYVFDHQAKDLSGELEAALTGFQDDVVDADANSRLRAFLDDCSFDRGARQLRQLYEQLMKRKIR